MLVGGAGVLTGRVGVDITNGVVSHNAGRRANRGSLDVQGRTNQTGCSGCIQGRRGRVAVSDLVVHRPLLLGGVDLLEVSGAGLGAGLLTSADKVGNSDGKQDADDQDDDHNLDERKGADSLLDIVLHGTKLPSRLDNAGDWFYVALCDYCYVILFAIPTVAFHNIFFRG